MGKARLRHLAVTIEGNKKAQLSLTSACLFFLACCSLADNFNPVTPSDFSLILPFPYVPSFLSLCYTAHQPYPILGYHLFTAQHLDSRPRLELLALANPGLANEKAQHRQTSTPSNKSSSSPPAWLQLTSIPYHNHASPCASVPHSQPGNCRLPHTLGLDTIIAPRS